MLFKQLRAQTGMGRWRIPTVSAAVQARCRLGRAPLKALFRPGLCGTAPAAHLPGMTAFGRELALLKVSADGTRLDVADTPANRAAFGDPPGGTVRAGQARTAGTGAFRSRDCLDAPGDNSPLGLPL